MGKRGKDESPPLTMGKAKGVISLRLVLRGKWKLRFHTHQREVTKPVYLSFGAKQTFEEVSLSVNTDGGFFHDSKCLFFLHTFSGSCTLHRCVAYVFLKSQVCQYYR